MTQHTREGGEQEGYSLMPMKSLVEAQARFSGNERLFTFLDDIYIASMPERATHTFVHHDKTKVWNRSGVEPEGIAELTRRQVRRDAVVWKGDPHLPHNQQGLRVFGLHRPTRVRP